MARTISGHVIDDRHAGLAGVDISSAGTHIGTTASDGSFSVTVAKPGNRIAVTFAAAGYVTNTRVYDGRRDSQAVVVLLWPIAHSLTFDASLALDVAFDKSRIQIPANALADGSGTPFSGRAVLQFTLFDVTQTLQRAAASGDFSGRLDGGGAPQRLNSYGIFDIAVRKAADGQPLDLRSGTSAELSIAVPKKLVKHAPKKIPYFDFDIGDGTWVQTGEFGFNADTLTYNGMTTSLGGEHNLDIPQDRTCVTVQVVRIWDQAPMANITVSASGPNWTSTGLSNVNGFCCLIVQRNASFTPNAQGQIASSYWGTPFPPTFTAPDFASGPEDCGDPVKCPLLGQVEVDLIVGLPG